MTHTLAQVGSLFTSAGLAGAGAAAVTIPIAIHLLARYRRKQEPWAAMRFLLEAFRKQRRRLQLEQLLLLIVRCLIVLVLGMALAGPLMGGLARLIGGGGNGRMVVLVIDDSLTAQAGDRFGRMQSLALDLVDDLQPQDRVALWRAGRPAQMLAGPDFVDPAALRQAIESIKPRYGRSDLLAALADVGRVLEDESIRPDQTFVFVISDLAQDTIDPSSEPSAALARLGDRSTMVLMRPMAPAANTQIALLQPRRSVILADPSAPTAVPVELRLRRFADEGEGNLVTLDVQLRTSADSDPIAQTQRTFNWSLGQTQAVVNLDLPVDRSLLPSLTGQSLVLRAAVDTAGAPDSLGADSLRYALVQLRTDFNVGVVTEIGRQTPGQISPEQWVDLALAPYRRDDPAVKTSLLDAVTVSPADLASLDAAIVVRPDHLTADARTALVDFAHRGGLVWIFPPASDAPAVWAGELMQELELPWQVAIDPISHDEEDLRSRTPQLDQLAPPMLRMLSADWQFLLRPIKIERQLDVDPKQPGTPPWLSTAAGKPILLGHPVGDGYVVMSTVALSSEWSNIVTRPLFIPLMHETLRSVVGRAPEDGVVTGDRPDLGRGFVEAQRLELEGGRGLIALVTETAEEGSTEARRMPREAFDRPGVYRAQPIAVGRRVVVNIDPIAGDTRSLDEAVVSNWMGRLGEWRWLDEADPGASLLATPARTNLGWPLLWLTLGLLLLETMLARWFSHARPAAGYSDRAGPHTAQGVPA